jgi:hypothetical protein
MPTRRIHIENVRIRLPRRAGGTVLDPRAVAAGCGSEILRGIAEAATGRTGAIRIGELMTGAIRAEGAAGAIPRQVAERIAADVRKKLG